jgi:hypothetical protein
MRIPLFRSISRKHRPFILLASLSALTSISARADISGDEDKITYEVTVERGFKSFYKLHGRYPSNWIELGIQDSCGGYQVDEYKHFPKRSEAIIWKPSECELSYKLVFGNRKGFRVVALAKGHVVSVYENFRATYFKTPLHDHGPYPAGDGKGTVY